jgi:hypothetical protein
MNLLQDKKRQSIKVGELKSELFVPMLLNLCVLSFQIGPHRIYEFHL